MRLPGVVHTRLVRVEVVAVASSPPEWALTCGRWHRAHRGAGQTVCGQPLLFEAAIVGKAEAKAHIYRAKVAVCCKCDRATSPNQCKPPTQAGQSRASGELTNKPKHGGLSTQVDQSTLLPGQRILRKRTRKQKSPSLRAKKMQQANLQDKQMRSDEASSSVRTVSGGLPGLGKRR